jgi:purine-nucleoside phosphorylase
MASQAVSEKDLLERTNATAEFIRSQVPEQLKYPKIGIICGSGLGGLADTIDAGFKVEIPYSSIPGFPIPTGKLP